MPIEACQDWAVRSFTPHAVLARFLTGCDDAGDFRAVSDHGEEIRMVETRREPTGL